MPERKTATINISKSLLNVSFITLAAIGSATSNPAVAGLSALPLALSASGTLKSLFEHRREEHLELPIPPWWTGEPQFQTWQEVCFSIEYHLLAILKGVEGRIRQETNYPSSKTINQLFIEQVAQHLSAWEVNPQDCYLVARYVTPSLLDKTSSMLKTAIETTREDSLARWLAQTAATLDSIQQATGSLLSLNTSPTTSTMAFKTGITLNVQAITQRLEKKVQDEAFDVYICYDENDEAAVMKIGEKLKANGILPWFDGLDMRPGVPKRLQQEQQIKKIPAVAVFIGRYAIARGRLLQIYAFIEQYIDHEYAVIPVLLEDAPKKPEIPPFLAEFGWVDFHHHMPDPLKQLIWGITGEHL